MREIKHPYLLHVTVICFYYICTDAWEPKYKDALKVVSPEDVPTDSIGQCMLSSF